MFIAANLATSQTSIVSVVERLLRRQDAVAALQFSLGTSLGLSKQADELDKLVCLSQASIHCNSSICFPLAFFLPHFHPLPLTHSLTHSYQHRHETSYPSFQHTQTVHWSCESRVKLSASWSQTVGGHIQHPAACLLDKLACEQHWHHCMCRRRTGARQLCVTCLETSAKQLKVAFKLDKYHQCL